MNADLAERIAHVQQRIANAAHRVQRDPAEISLIAVSKTHPLDLISQAIEAGITDLGENRVQEAEGKIHAQSETERAKTRWHLIGHLQSNKARRAVQLFDMIHTVDSLKLAQTLNRIVAEESDVETDRLPILLQVNVSGEASKEGFNLVGGMNSQDWLDFVATVREIIAMPYLHVQGFMTIPPFDVDLEHVVRPCFRMVRELRDALQVMLNHDFPHLSMGMSGDFEIAIEEGATLVRVGTAIFGNR